MQPNHFSWKHRNLNKRMKIRSLCLSRKWRCNWIFLSKSRKMTSCFAVWINIQSFQIQHFYEYIYRAHTHRKHLFVSSYFSVFTALIVVPLHCLSHFLERFKCYAILQSESCACNSTRRFQQFTNKSQATISFVVWFFFRFYIYNVR